MATIPASRQAVALMERGQALGERGHVLAALHSFREALALDPALGQAHYGAAMAASHLGRWSEALAAYDEAARLLPGSGEPWVGQARCLLRAGRRREAVEALLAGARADPSSAAELESHALFAMQYGDEYAPGDVYAAHVEWARRHAPAAAAPPAFPRRAAGRLRIGFASPSFLFSAMSFALLPLLRHLDRDRFEVFGYSEAGALDETAQRIRGLCTAWRETRALDDARFAQAVRADGIDVMVDLAGHTPGHRLRALARRVAPVQMSWLDYFNTTGVAAMDALVADDVTLAPGGEPAQRFVERPVSAGPCRYPYEAPSYRPELVARPPRGPVVFGCFARLAKVCGTTLSAWCAALEALPGSRLVLKNDSFTDAAIREAVLRAFAARGIDPARLELRPVSVHRDMLAQYNDVDIALDTLPCNGGITTLEALSMGRPVVTMRGGTLLSRQGESILAACGHADWVAADAAGFAALARALAADRAALAGLHMALPGRLARSPLCDGAGFARRFEQLLLDLARVSRHE